MITEHIKELREIKSFYEFRHRQRLGLKPQNLAPVHPEGSILYKTFASLYRKAMRNWRAGLRKLNRQIAGVDYAITLLEATSKAREVLRSKANARAVDSLTEFRRGYTEDGVSRLELNLMASEHERKKLLQRIAEMERGTRYIR